MHHKMLHFQDALSRKWKYRKLKKSLSEKLREIYYRRLPEGFKIMGDPAAELYSSAGTLIAVGYEKIVIGDYGAFLEINKENVIGKNLEIKKGQEYRYNDPKYKDNVKYLWYTTKDDSDVKIYYQKKTVPYADYKPKKFYISPYEVELKKK